MIAKMSTIATTPPIIATVLSVEDWSMEGVGEREEVWFMDGEGGRSMDGERGRSMDGEECRSMEGEGGRSMDGEGGRSMDGEGGRSMDEEGDRSMDGEGDGKHSLTVDETVM